MIPRAALVCIGLVATGFFWLVENVRANDLRLGQGYGARAVEPCDPFAEDLDTVAPPETCMRFGGRVRVDLGAGPSQAGKTYGAAPAAVRVDAGDDGSAGRPPRRLGSGVTPSHLRIQSPDATGMIAPANAR
jgi:hypothetical protein